MLRCSVEYYGSYHMSFLKTYGPKLGLRDDRNVFGPEHVVLSLRVLCTYAHTQSHQFFLFNYCICELLDQCLLYSNILCVLFSSKANQCLPSNHIINPFVIICPVSISYSLSLYIYMSVSHTCFT